MATNILTGDCRQVLATLPAKSFHTCVTSPPLTVAAAVAPVPPPPVTLTVGALV